MSADISGEYFPVDQKEENVPKKKNRMMNKKRGISEYLKGR